MAAQKNALNVQDVEIVDLNVFMKKLERYSLQKSMNKEPTWRSGAHA